MLSSAAARCQGGSCRPKLLARWPVKLLLIDNDASMSVQLSVLITTFNERTQLPALLASLDGWVDDILIVDSFSTDGTAEYARTQGVRVLQRSYQGPSDQKNWAIPQMLHPWVLILDADERPGPTLRTEIERILTQARPPADAYWIPRRNHFMGKRIHYSGWQGDAVIRLIRRDRCRYDDKQVHEEIDQQGLITGRLKGWLDHYTFKDSAHFLAKMERYALWSAKDHAATTQHISYFHLAIKPAFRFFKHYVLQQGFRDGRVGFIISAIMAWGVFLRYVKMLEVRQSTQ